MYDSLATWGSEASLAFFIEGFPKPFAINAALFNGQTIYHLNFIDRLDWMLGIVPGIRRTGDHCVQSVLFFHAGKGGPQGPWSLEASAVGFVFCVLAVLLLVGERREPPSPGLRSSANNSLK